MTVKYFLIPDLKYKYIFYDMNNDATSMKAEKAMLAFIIWLPLQSEVRQ